MRILVCVKQVPDAEAPIRIGEDGRSLLVEKSAWRMNRCDEYAIEEALRIREAFPGTRVEVLSVGPPRAADVLRRALSLGADEGIHLLGGEEPEPLPGEIAARIASFCRERLYDLILAGVMAEDDMQGQVGPIVAERLEIPCATAVMAQSISPDRKTIRVERELEGGHREALEMPLPSLLAVQSGINRPRWPALSHVLRARTQPLTTLAEEAPDPPEKRESVVRLFPPEASGRALFLEGTPAEKAERLAAILREKGFL